MNKSLLLLTLILQGSLFAADTNSLEDSSNNSDKNCSTVKDMKKFHRQKRVEMSTNEHIVMRAEQFYDDLPTIQHTVETVVESLVAVGSFFLDPLGPARQARVKQLIEHKKQKNEDPLEKSSQELKYTFKTVCTSQDSK